MSVSTTRKVFAYLFNVVIVGSGFIIVEGWKGMLKAWAWMIPFMILNTFRHEIGLLWAGIPLIGSYIHLYRTIRNTDSGNAQSIAE